MWPKTLNINKGNWNEICCIFAKLLLRRRGDDGAGHNWQVWVSHDTIWRLHHFLFFFFFFLGCNPDPLKHPCRGGGGVSRRKWNNAERRGFRLRKKVMTAPAILYKTHAADWECWWGAPGEGDRPGPKGHRRHWAVGKIRVEWPGVESCKGQLKPLLLVCRFPFNLIPIRQLSC